MIRNNWEIKYKLCRDCNLLGKVHLRLLTHIIFVCSYIGRHFSTITVITSTLLSSDCNRVKLKNKRCSSLSLCPHFISLFCICVFILSHIFFFFSRTINWQSNVRRRHEINIEREREYSMLLWREWLCAYTSTMVMVAVTTQT